MASIPRIPDTQTSGYLALPTVRWPISTTTIPDVLPHSMPSSGCIPDTRAIHLEQWLDLWVSRRYAGGAIPGTVDPTPAINRDVVTLTRPMGEVSSLTIGASQVARMADAIGAWTGASKAALAAIVGVRSVKTLYNWRDRPATALRPATQMRLMRIHALLRSIIMYMGPLDGKAWLVSGHPSSLDLLTRGDITAVEQRARDAGVHIGSARRILSSDERDVLRRGGFRLQPLPRTMSDVATRTQALATRLLTTGHTVDETAHLLGRSVTAVRRLINRKMIYAVPRDGDWIVPDFQFDDGRLISGIDVVMPHIPNDAHIVEVYTWFTSPSPDLEGEDGRPLSPRDWLRAGGPTDPIVAQAVDL